MLSVLHAGCGGDPLPPWFGEVHETRLDINPAASPHIVASMADMPMVADESFDSVYTCHALEHLHPDDVESALREFRRVLKPGGHVIVIVPDVEGVSPTTETLYMSSAGPINGRDLLYGQAAMAKGNPHMQHRCGFVRDSLESSLLAAGFSKAACTRASSYNLIGAAVK